MARGLVTRSSLEDAGNAIRYKLNTTREYLPSEMGDAIRSIPEYYKDVYVAYEVGTQYAAGWLSYSQGGEAFEPADGVLYLIGSGSRANLLYRWDGTQYVAVGGGDETDPTVPSWAKEPTKPTYTAQEVGALPDTTQIPSKVSDLTNDSGFLTTETDPTVPAWAKASTKPSYTASEVGAIPTSEKGAAGGVASLDSSGKVPSSQLPSYVDDVEEYAGMENFPATGESGKIYVDTTTNLSYRWSGTQYVTISSPLGLGETSDTAYRGDRGKVAYDHAQLRGSAYSSGLYKIATNSEGHVTGAEGVTKADITALGIPSQDTTYQTATSASDGLMSASDKAKLDGMDGGGGTDLGFYLDEEGDLCQR